VSFLLDSTIGLFVIYIGLKITQIIIRQKDCDSLKFGEYGKCIIFYDTIYIYKTRLYISYTVKDAGSSFLKLLAFFKSGFNRCRNENYVK